MNKFSPTAKLHTPFCQKFLLLLLVSLATLLIGCKPGIVRLTPEQIAELDPVDEELIVDCLLPGIIKKTGRFMVTVTPRRPVKITAHDCELQGGEYVLDPNRDQALKIWLADAERGDKVAQNNVGEIYEKGLGVKADYAEAAKWYLKAAKQGNKRAQQNLSFLYEQGLGVPKDPEKAFYWRSQAYGLAKPSELEPADRAQIEALKSTVKQKILEKDELQEQLRQTKLALEQVQNELDRLRTQGSSGQVALLKLEQELARSKENEKALSAQIEQLEADLETSRQALKEKEQHIYDLKETVALTPDRKARLEKLERELEQKTVLLEALQEKLKKSQQEAEIQTEREAELRRQLEALKSEIKSTDEKLKDERKTLAYKDFDFGSYHALIIGNTNYKNLDRLKTPVYDAKNLAELLESKYGFKVYLLLDTDRKEIIDILSTLRNRLTEKDNLLIYYAGHGIKDDYDGYWLGVNAESNKKGDWVYNRAVRDMISEMKAKRILIIADSCYAATFFQVRGVTRLPWIPPASEPDKITWIKKRANVFSRMAITSGGVKPVIDKAANSNHSVFAKHLIDFLKKNREVIEAYELYDAIKHKVANESEALGLTQIPEFGRIKAANDENGVFLFAPKLNRSAWNVGI